MVSSRADFEHDRAGSGEADSKGEVVASAPQGRWALCLGCGQRTGPHWWWCPDCGGQLLELPAPDPGR